MVRKASVLAGMVCLFLIPYFAPLHGQSLPPLELISIGTDGLAGNHHSGSDGIIPPRSRISADGRYVVFESYASTIVCQDDDFSTRDVFVRDRLTGRATVASVASDGGEANHNSFDPVISADGRYVAFVSQATNLVPGDTNGFNDIFLRDLVAGTTTRLSVSSAEAQANSVSHGPAINGDGRYRRLLQQRLEPGGRRHEQPLGHFRTRRGRGNHGAGQRFHGRRGNRLR